MSLFEDLFGKSCNCNCYEQKSAKQEAEDDGWCVLGDVTIHQSHIRYIYRGVDGNAYVRTYLEPEGVGLKTNVSYEEIAKLF